MEPIAAVYAWVATQKDGTERLVSAALPNGAIPLISHNRQLVEGFLGLVQQMVDDEDMPIDLVRFGARETLQQVRASGEGAVVSLRKA